jgi:hypothetical protein
MKQALFIVAVMCAIGMAASEGGSCCEIVQSLNQCKCVSAECQCDAAKGACFCMKPQPPSASDVAAGQAGAGAAPSAETAAAESAATEASTKSAASTVEPGTAASAAASAVTAGASNELQIRKDEHKCKSEAHKLTGGESVVLAAIKACEQKTIEASKAAGLYAAEQDKSASDISQKAAKASTAAAATTL